MGGVDLVASAVLAIAGLRGLFLGIVREAFSLGGLAAGVIAARAFGPEAAAALRPHLTSELPTAILNGVAMVIVALLAFTAVRVIGVLVRRGVRAAGLGPVDRIGGATLGLAEGALALALALTVGAALAGPDHPLLAHSRAWSAWQEARHAFGAELPTALRDVAAPPPTSRPRN